MDKFARIALLYDFYGPLLTSKQRDYWDLYYQQDFSLGEIAEDGAVSRQAVHDLLKRTEKILLGYEEKLGLVERHLKQQEKLNTLNKLIKQLEPADSPVLAGIKQLLLELMSGD